MEFLPFAGIAFLIITTLILAQQVAKQSEFLTAAAPLLLNLKLLSYLLPNIIVVALPFALLLGAIITLNRLSADSELVSIRASGLAPLALSSPLLLAACGATLISLATTHYYGPWTLRQLRWAKHHIIREMLGLQIKPKTFNTYFPGYLIYVQGIDHSTGIWQGVFIIKKNTDQSPSLLTAAEGVIRITEATHPTIEAQLSQGLSLETASAPNKHNLVAFNKLTIKLSDTGPAPTATNTPVQEMSTAELAERIAIPQTNREKLQASIEYHKRFAVPFACLTLMLLAISIGSQTARHSGRTVGIAIGFAIAVTYYLVFIVGQNLALSGALPPIAGTWMANVICTGLALTISHLQLRLKAASGLPFRRRMSPTGSPFISKHTGRPTQRRLTNLINYLLLSELLQYSLLALSILILTSITFTLFDLIPAITSRGVSTQYALAYLGYLTPQIAYYLTPFALLLGILTAYSLLSRSSQITALLASGQSWLRLSLPILLIALAATIMLPILSEKILPYTNREQDARYHQIKGRQLEQATLAFGQKWVYGTNHTIYSYQYLDTDNRLLNTTAYQLDPNNYLLREMTYASQASRLTDTSWEIPSGHRYLIGSQGLLQASPSPDRPLTLVIPDGPDLFRRTVNEAAKMNRAELELYLRHLHAIGAPTTDLRIDLGSREEEVFPLELPHPDGPSHPFCSNPYA
jgi:lipopolysaccharide export system permease protein